MAKKKTAAAAKKKTRRSKPAKKKGPRRNAAPKSKATPKAKRGGKRASQGKRLAGWELVTKEAVFGYLKSAKLSVAALSRTLEVSPAAVYSWKAGRRIPSAEAQRKLAGILSGKARITTKKKIKAKRLGPKFDASDLRSTREGRGLSRGALASRLGVSTSSLFNWEVGKSAPRGRNLEKIASFMSEDRSAPAATAATAKALPGEGSGSPEAVMGAAQVASAYLATGQPLSTSQVIAFVRDLREALS